MACKRRSREAWYDDELRPIRTWEEVVAYEAFRSRMQRINPSNPLPPPTLHPDGLVPVEDAEMPPVVVVSEHFSFKEWTRTSQPYVNVPTEAHLRAMRATSHNVLEPWRRRVGALRITSGYRSQAVNDALRRQGKKASKYSQHLLGQAADVQPLATSLENAWRELVRMIAEDRLPVDEAILYVREAGDGWIHVSHGAAAVPRAEVLVDLWGSDHLVRWANYTGPVVIPEEAA